MSQFSEYWSNRIIDHMFRGEPFEPPKQLWLGLLTKIPSTGSSSGVEIKSSSYSRVPVFLGGPSQGRTSNRLEVAFPVANEAWGDVVGAAIYDAERGGHLLSFGEISRPRELLDGDQMKFREGEVKLELV